MTRKTFFKGLIMTVFLIFGIQSVCQGEGMIYGCYKKNNGQLRVVTDHTQCHNSELPILLYGEPAGPQEFTVNCGAGETVADALSQAPATGHVTITINGVCQESLTITRDDITLRGDSPGDGLTHFSTDGFVLNLMGARRIRIENLTLTGGGTGLNATSGATFEASGLHVIGAGKGVNLDSEASGTLLHSFVEDCSQGIGTWGSGTLTVIGGEVKNSNMFGVQASGGSYIKILAGFTVTGSGHHAIFAGGGFITINDAIVEDNQSVGVWAMDGGSITVGSNTHIRRNNGGVVAWAGTVSLREGAKVTNNHWNGIGSTFGGHVDLERVTVEYSEGAGISVSGSSSVQVSDSFIRYNDYDGIQLSDTSVAIFQHEPNVISNNGFYGINCNPVPPNVAQFSGDPGTVTDNGYGEINCP